uniref:Protein strawberry notch homolog 2 n=1 Tax=Neolamprologus brichardi TaxID=32507 RepID=A0A3Q4IEY1_NEOBR
MPTLTSAMAMDGENYLHPEGPQLDNDLPCLDDISTNSLFSSPTDSLSEYAATEEEEEAEEEEAEELGHVDTYAEYKPSKATIGISHPDIVVETNTLSSVPPPDITYTLSIPESTIKNGLLSALQLEAIIYACQPQQHEVILQNKQRAGFLIGDGAGVGKGRTVAGIILENYLKGRKKALFSISNDLKFDAERDLKDIDAATIPVHALNKIKYGDTATSEGVLFATYSALIGESQAGGQLRTRIKQILDWCKPEFDGVIIFDECHKAKNATSTKMGKAVLDLQSKLPHARVVYASATASEPKNMIYMSRLGIWGEGTPFRTFDDFLHSIEKRGVGAMEIVAMDMKVSGMYIARQLSFSGVSFRIEEIGLDGDFKEVYNKAAKLWAEALKTFMQAADELGMVSRKSLWGQFWSSHQRFFKYLCIAAKVRSLVELAQKELEAGKLQCIVIGLQSTGESRTREVLDENDGHLDRFVSAAGVFQSLVTKHFPSEKQSREKAPSNKRKKPRGRQPKVPKHSMDNSIVINITDDSSSDSDGIDTDSNSSPDSLLDNDDVIFVNQTRIEEMKQDLLNKIAELGKELPLNTLDELIDKFGGPDKVSEMTGRKGRVVRRPDGTVRYESRAEQGLTIDHINLKEKDRFMSGEKLVAIISEAASSGISLQADKRVKNQRRRVHMTLELPWSADRAIQQFRTHRSNQVTAPEYIFLISELAGERRFASIVAKRLESLGALTHGDRRATETRDLSRYNFENKYGTKALDKITKAILGFIDNKVPPPKGYPGGDAMFFRMKAGMVDVGILCKEPRIGNNNEKCSITKFLNRILGLEVHKQNHLFQYFTDNFDYLIEKDKKEGKYDMGILLAPGNDEIYEETQETFLTAGNPQDGQVVLYKQISVDRGMPWDEAYNKSLNLSGHDEGFYLSMKLRGNYPCVLLAEQGRGKNFVVYKPNIGKQTHPESLEKLHQKYRKVTPEEARDCWENQFTFSFKKCSHANNGKCKKIEEGQECLQGMRLRQYHMLCGALLRVWKRVSDVVSDITNSSILQIVRLKTKQHNKQVIKIPENCVPRVRDELLQMDDEVKKRRKEKEVAAENERKRKLEYLQGHRQLVENLTNHKTMHTQSLTQSFDPRFPLQHRMHPQ